MSQLIVNAAFVSKRPTGLSIYTRNVVPHLGELSPTVLTPEAIAPYDPHPQVPPTMTPDQGSRGHARRLVWTQTRLLQIYRQIRAPLLFTPVPEAPLFAKCRYVATVHDLIPLRFPKRRSPLTAYFRYYVPAVLHQAQHILCNSQTTARDVCDRFSIPAQRLTPIPLACDADHFRFLDLPTQPYFLYVGRYDPYKNLERVVAALAALPRSLACDLWIAGSPDDRYRPALQRQAEELGVGDRLRWLDYVPYDQLPILLNQAIALVFPSLWEGFGLPVLEAMACGTPVITSNLSSLPEVAGDAALLVDPYRTEAIAAAMKTMILDDLTRSQLRQAGLARSQQFSWAKTGAATQAILRECLSHLA
jgi:glycosyltransferase involved in cell wall biosynthesis